MTQRTDPIVEEIYEARREIAKRFEGDIRRISEDARQRQIREGRPVWHPEAANQALEQTRDSVQRNGQSVNGGRSTPTRSGPTVPWDTTCCERCNEPRVGRVRGRATPTVKSRSGRGGLEQWMLRCSGIQKPRHALRSHSRSLIAGLRLVEVPVSGLSLSGRGFLQSRKCRFRLPPPASLLLLPRLFGALLSCNVRCHC